MAVFNDNLCDAVGYRRDPPFPTSIRYDMATR